MNFLVAFLDNYLAFFWLFGQLEPGQEPLNVAHRKNIAFL